MTKSTRELIIFLSILASSIFLIYSGHGEWVIGMLIVLYMAI